MTNAGEMKMTTPSSTTDEDELLDKWDKELQEELEEDRRAQTEHFLSLSDREQRLGNAIAFIADGLEDRGFSSWLFTAAARHCGIHLPVLESKGIRFGDLGICASIFVREEPEFAQLILAMGDAIQEATPVEARAENSDEGAD